MKTVVLGSCLSGSVAEQLHRQFGFDIVDSMGHVRLDAIAKHLGGQVTFGAPDSVIAEIKDKYFNSKSKSDLINVRRLSSQFAGRLNSLVKKISQSELLILDNNYDLGRYLLNYQSSSGDWYTFSNVSIVSESAEVQMSGLMDVNDYCSVYQSLIDAVKLINPRIHIVFIQYPVSGFVHERYRLRVQRSMALKNVISALRGWSAFPLVSVDRLNLSTKGAHYFSQLVYTAFAAAIVKVTTGIPLPFDPTTSLSLSALLDFSGLSDSSDRRAVLPKTHGAGANPYADLPDRQFWKAAVGDRYPLAISQLYVKKWSISVSDKVATCGSCFAQHIGRRMQANNFNFLDVEPPPHFVEPRDYVKNGYSIYSARYGNVYTSTQLLQLFKRAFGLFQCSETWSKTTDVGEVRFVDPFRPNLNPAGWGSGDEVLVEQVQHLSACRRLFSELDVLVFTMGLTECWYSKSTGAVYPIAPGVNGGVFDLEVHAFKNLTFQEVMDDMVSFIEHLREVNPKARLLLTVSPVPLTATAEDQHVLVASMHSKSVLRAVAGELARRFDFVDYFPSYEIVASVPFKGLFFQANLRTVHEEGVDFVMSHFFSQHSVDTRLLENTEVDSEEFCDEVFLDLARLSNGGQSAAV